MASRRNIEARKAIEEAWKREQELVKQGKGTRDWTPEQQKDILENGKAYDEEGRAFEGHHKKSVAAYPEHQGNPDNIQFLTRDEHQQAHGGNYQNSTNGEYNPIDNTTIDYGDELIPNKIIDLSNPIVKVTVENNSNEKDKQGTKEPNNNKSPPKQSVYSKKNPPLEKIGFHKRVFNWIGDKIDKGFDMWCNFEEKSPILSKIIKATASTVLYNAVEYGVNKGISKVSGAKPNTNTNSKVNNNIASSNPTVKNEPIVSSPEVNVDKGPRATPKPNVVRGHTQTYHTKDGPVVREKAPYPRGGNNN